MKSIKLGAGFAALAALAAVSLSLSACGAPSGAAAGAEPGPNSQARSTAFKKLGGEMKIVGDVIAGKQAFDAEAFKAQAAKLAEAGAEPFNHFEKDTTGSDGSARPEVWSEPEKFKAAEDQFKADLDAFVAAANEGDLAKAAPAFGKFAGNCKSCHEAFKNRT